ncbi:MAG: hypothetical protein EAX86_03800 [Candidatus Heimdallarchaeota archaeon]|nr:hypothetical protein [Candidatus Heimdallarchaeota archaeon]
MKVISSFFPALEDWIFLECRRNNLFSNEIYYSSLEVSKISDFFACSIQSSFSIIVSRYSVCIFIVGSSYIRRGERIEEVI